MKSRIHPRRLVLLLLAGLLLAAVLGLGLRNFVRSVIVIPLAYVAWLAGILIRSTPQIVFWGLLLLLVAIVALRRLWVVPARRQRSIHGELSIPKKERVGFWAILTFQAHGDYSRSRLADLFRRLALSVLAFREQVDLPTLESRIASGEVDLPPELQPFLSHTRPRPRKDGVSRLWTRGGGIRPPWTQPRSDAFRRLPPASPLEDAVTYLEEQLEIQHADNP
jgi:hypothetical protein